MVSQKFEPLSGVRIQTEDSDGMGPTTRQEQATSPLSSPNGTNSNSPVQTAERNIKLAPKQAKPQVQIKSVDKSSKLATQALLKESLVSKENDANTNVSFPPIRTESPTYFNILSAHQETDSQTHDTLQDQKNTTQPCISKLCLQTTYFDMPLPNRRSVESKEFEMLPNSVQQRLISRF